jgi:hypothetical protein
MKGNLDRIGKFFGALSAVNKGLFPLLGMGPRLHPEMEAMIATDQGIGQSHSGIDP